MPGSKSRNKIVYVLVVVVIVALLIVSILINVSGCLRVAPIEVKNETVVNVSNLQQQIVSIGELATIEYNYQNVINETDSRMIGEWNIPFTQKTYIILVEGTMKIGIDTSGILVTASEDTKTISITIPKAKILSHELDEGSVQVLEERSGLFNPVSIKDWTELAATQKQEMEDKVSKTDMFTRAEDEAAKMLKALIGGAVPEDYTVYVITS